MLNSVDTDQMLLPVYDMGDKYLSYILTLLA